MIASKIQTHPSLSRVTPSDEAAPSLKGWLQIDLGLAERCWKSLFLEVQESQITRVDNGFDTHQDFVNKKLVSGELWVCKSHPVILYLPTIRTQRTLKYSDAPAVRYWTIFNTISYYLSTLGEGKGITSVVFFCLQHSICRFAKAAKFPFKRKMDLLYLRSYRLPLTKISKNEVACDPPNPHELWVCKNLFGFLSHMFFRGLQKLPKILVVQRCFAKIRSVSRRHFPKPLGNWDENSKCHFGVGGKFDLLNFVGRIKPTWMISWTDITTIVRDVTSWLNTTPQTFIAVVTLQIWPGKQQLMP